MNILFLRGFNNYFNRVIKKYSTLADYQSNSTSHVNFESINFNPNDGVATELVLGNESQKENNLPLDWENIGTPDYCICYEMVESSPVIRSRWFVLESERLRTGQYRLALKRDVVAEHFDTIKVSPCFIEKGMVNDIDNPLLYNKESMSYNQIKTDETPVTDSTGSGWIVGYIAKNQPTENTTVEVNKIIESEDDYIDVEDLDFTLEPGVNELYEMPALNEIYVGVPRLNAAYDDRYTEQMELFNVLDSFKFRSTPAIGGSGTLATCVEVTSDMSPSTPVITRVQGSPSTFDVASYNNTSNMYLSDSYMAPYYGVSVASLKQTGRFVSISRYPSYRRGSVGSFGTNSDDLKTLINRNIIGMVAPINRILNAESANYSFITPADDIGQYDGKKIRIGNQLYVCRITATNENFRLVYGGNISSTNTNAEQRTLPSSVVTDIRDVATTLSTIVANNSTSTSEGRMYQCANVPAMNNTGVMYRIVTKYTINLSLFQTEKLSVVIKANRSETYDSPADLFIIPYGGVEFKVTSSDANTKTTDAEQGIAIARAIAHSFDSGCYDLQILPYCPSDVVQNLIADNGYLALDSLTSSMYSIVTSTVAGTVGFVLFPSSCTGTFTINKLITMPAYGYSQALNYKIVNETELYRLISPNYNGQFEFSLAKNKGILNFNVDYTYKPYMPYIHVNPDFKGLYGSDWDDARGLICGGDFSLTFTTDAWTNYKLNNKNFQQIFDRQIQNMDVNNSIALEKQEFQATVGTITSAVGGALGGAAAGATAGMMTGNPFVAAGGAIIGGIAGGLGSGLASAYGAEKDRDWLTRQQQEARSFAIDMYGYQLGNIQAMPYSIRGSDVLINNYKIWPFVERFTAKTEEVDALVNKIKFNGMTIMVVGKIEDYCFSEDFDHVFIKGQLIRLESDDINDDFHIADAIYQEINKGVYIPSGGL